MLSAGEDLAAVQKLLPQLSVPWSCYMAKKIRWCPWRMWRWLEQQLASIGKTNLFVKIVHPDYNHFIPWEHSASCCGSYTYAHAEVAGALKQ